MSLLDWIYPPKCISCKTLLPPSNNKKWLCQECKPLFISISEPFCKLCGHPGEPCPSCYGKSFYFESNRAAFTYEDTVRDLMHSIKFKGQRQVAQGLGLLMAEYAKDWDINGDYIIPVPLHPSKKWSRGFNQATVLAKPLSKALKIPLSENMLRRIKKTTPQNQLNSHQRIENLEGAFLFDKKRYKPDTVILVDDIFTSGSTMSACAKVLKDSGVKRVLCVSLSIALKEMED